MATAQDTTLSFSGQHWHFIGILGSGMHGLAKYAAERGIRVTGSDVQNSPAVEELVRLGINVRFDQDHPRLERDIKLVVASQAIADDNPELLEAKRLGIEIVRYPEMVGMLMDDQPGIAVAGAHGKSTTTSMISFILQRVGLDPSFVIGAEVPQLGGSSHCGKGRYLVAEACEYKRSFLFMAPHIAVITNIDLEHTDYYYDLWDIQQAFGDFAEQVDPDGALVLNADDPNSQPVKSRAECDVTTYGLDNMKAHYRAERMWRAKKHTNFDLVIKGKNHGRFSTKLYGTHNIYNTLAAIAGCHRAGVDLDQMRGPVSEFEGAARRLQLLGEPWNIAILSDYAHHPNEIRATIAAAQQRFPKRRIFCIFQPHQYSRTRTMISEFANAFSDAWVTFVADIYAARDSEEDRRAVCASDLVHLMNHRGLTAHYVPEFADIEEIIVGEVVPEDVVLVMGAGSIWQIARNIVPRIAEKGRKQIAA
jgi:UDP-N-acetylmuramate--alanine ligase